MSVRTWCFGWGANNQVAAAATVASTRPTPTASTIRRCKQRKRFAGLGPDFRIVGTLFPTADFPLVGPDGSFTGRPSKGISASLGWVTVEALARGLRHAAG